MLISHITTPKPSLELALLCFSIVKSYNPAWVSDTLTGLIPEGGPSLENLSRLKLRLQPMIQETLEKAKKRGRPKREGNQSEDALLKALLSVAAATLSEMKVKKSSIKRNLTSAYERLKSTHGVSLKCFCSSLGLKERTFRSWRKSPPPIQLSLFDPPDVKKKKDKNLGRFSPEITAPGLQLMGDTTDWELFGIPLKVMAAMDPGERQRKLWESFKVDIKESSEAIIENIRGVDHDVLQLITDQGTPYLAELADREYERMGLEHEPQKEGTPTEKAPLERSFRKVKDALAPLARISNVISGMVPSLKDSRLAISIGRLLIAIFLKIYLEGRSHLNHPLEGKNPEVVRAIVEEQREKARAEGRSKRLLLKAIHREFFMDVSELVFVRAFRNHALEDIKEAERRLRDKACRCVAKRCDRYFGGIIRNVADQGRVKRRTLREEKIKRSEERRKEQERDAKRTFLEDHPPEAIQHGLDLLALLWNPEAGEVIYVGVGPGRYYLRNAFLKIKDITPLSALDEINTGLRVWEGRRADLEPQIVEGVKKVFKKILMECAPFPQATTKDLTRIMIRERIQPPVEKQEIRRSQPEPHLRN